MTLLDLSPTLKRALLGVSQETREAIIGELVTINEHGRAEGYESAAKVVDAWRDLGRHYLNNAIDNALLELRTRAKVARKER